MQERVVLGIILGITSTDSFEILLKEEFDQQKLKMRFVELEVEGDTIVAKIMNIMKKNPLLDEDQTIFVSKLEDQGLSLISNQFTFGVAKCEVLGVLRHGRLEANTRVIPPTLEVYKPSHLTLQALFASEEAQNLHLGEIEKIDPEDLSIRVTLDGDEVVTKHLCIFGQTGSGKTNTAAVIVEELLARGYKSLIFDPHDDYQRIESFSNRIIELKQEKCSGTCSVVQQLASQLELSEEVTCRRLLRLASIIFSKDIINILQNSCNDIKTLDPAIILTEFAHNLKEDQKRLLNVFPEIKIYGDPPDREFTIQLLAGFSDEDFTAPQRRALQIALRHPSLGRLKGKEFITRLRQIIDKLDDINEATAHAIAGKLGTILSVYISESQVSQAVDLDVLLHEVVDLSSSPFTHVYIFSLSSLSNSVRKVVVGSVISWIFRRYKFGIYSAAPTPRNPVPNAVPVCFFLEEARSMIPAGRDDESTASTRLSRSAVRAIAFEGRKYNLGFVLVSQKPRSVDEACASQANTFIIHQLKSPDDQRYVSSVTEGMTAEELRIINSLGQGRAIVSGTAVKTSVLVKVRSRDSLEGMEKPRPVTMITKKIDQLKKRLQ
ncbi:MAG: ATP-binding protein [Promethearchaeota archaeon]